jgi:hypothetical protein
MQDSVGNAYIGQAVDELVAIFGVEPPVPEEELSWLYSHIGSAQCITRIAASLKLPVQIRLSRVSRGDTSRPKQFETTQVAKADRAGRQVEGIIAQVSIPHDLPLYGSSALTGFPIDIRIGTDATQSPDTFIAVVAHELSHVVLHSLRHNDWNNEIYTDLTAMILGFSRVMRSGRKIETPNSNTTYGYLSDDEFEYAFKKLNGITESHQHAENNLRRLITHYFDALSAFERTWQVFKKCLESIDTRRSGRVKRADVATLVRLHQPSYHDQVELVIGTHRKAFNRLGEMRTGATSYTKERARALATAVDELQSLVRRLSESQRELQNHLASLVRNLSLIQRLRLFLGSRLGTVMPRRRRSR